MSKLFMFVFAAGCLGTGFCGGYYFAGTNESVPKTAPADEDDLYAEFLNAGTTLEMNEAMGKIVRRDEERYLAAFERAKRHFLTDGNENADEFARELDAAFRKNQAAWEAWLESEIDLIDAKSGGGSISSSACGSRRREILKRRTEDLEAMTTEGVMMY